MPNLKPKDYNRHIDRLRANIDRLQTSLNQQKELLKSVMEEEARQRRKIAGQRVRMPKMSWSEELVCILEEAQLPLDAAAIYAVLKRNGLIPFQVLEEERYIKNKLRELVKAGSIVNINMLNNSYFILPAWLNTQGILADDFMVRLLEQIRQCNVPDTVSWKL